MARQHSPIPQNSPIMARQHSPIPQNSPIMARQHSPIPQHSPIMARQHSPIPQHSPIMARQHSPIPQHSPIMAQQHSPIPQHSPIMARQHSPIPQHSPIMARQHSPIPQHSTIMARQHSPILQHSPIMARQHSPVMTNSPMDMPISPSTTGYIGSTNSPMDIGSTNSPMDIGSTNSPMDMLISPSTTGYIGSTIDFLHFVNVNEVHIRVFYGAIPILSKTVDCSNGCRIYANGDPSRIHGEDNEMRIRRFVPSNAHNICLPNSHAHSSAREIFDAMKCGVLIKSQNGNVYVTPLCRVIVYCGNSTSSTPDILQKEKCTIVFDYKSHFRPALEHYALVPGESPSPYIILSLGQNWGSGRHVTENLVSIIITPSQAKHVIETGLTHLLTEDLLPYSVNIDQATEQTDLDADSHSHVSIY